MFFVGFKAIVKIDAVYVFTTTLEADMETVVLQFFFMYLIS